MASFTIRLIEGSTNRTPWGLVTTSGKPVVVNDSDKEARGRLAYFRGNGRYSVEEQSERRAAPADGRPVPPSARPQTARSGPAKGQPITEERTLALARRILKPDMNKGQLLALARDLGVKDINEETTNRKLVALIGDRQAAILKAHEAPEGEPEAEGGGEGEPGEGGAAKQD
jgi:hypothetical protein